MNDNAYEALGHELSKARRRNKVLGSLSVVFGILALFLLLTRCSAPPRQQSVEFPCPQSTVTVGPVAQPGDGDGHGPTLSSGDSVRGSSSAATGATSTPTISTGNANEGAVSGNEAPAPGTEGPMPSVPATINAG